MATEDPNEVGYSAGREKDVEERNAVELGTAGVSFVDSFLSRPVTCQSCV